MKGYVGKNNVEMTLSSVIKLVGEAMGRIGPLEWKNVCENRKKTRTHIGSGMPL